jgi:hypothetical protein
MAASTAISLDSGLTTLRGAAVSPSGRLAVTYGVDVLVFTVTIWDVATQQPIRPIETSRAPMTVSFTPDEASIVGVFVSQEDGSAEVIRWPVTETAGSGEVLHTETGVAGVAMARDTGTVVFRSALGSVTVLRINTGLTTPLGPSAEVRHVAVSPRGSIIALATAKDIQVVRFPSGGPADAEISLHPATAGPVQAMDCTENNVLIAVGNTISAVYGTRPEIIRTDSRVFTSQSEVIFTGAGPVQEMALSTAGDVLAVAQGSRIDLLDLQTTATVDQINSSSAVERLNFSLDDRFLITAHEDNTARLWDLTLVADSSSGSGSGAPDWFSQLSPASHSALAYADGLRLALGRQRVHIDHLLHGVNREGRSARQVLDQARVTPAEVSAALAAATGADIPPTVVLSSLTSMPPISRHVGEALDRAAAIAGAAHSPRIRSQDLLRGALSITGCSMVQALANQGLDLAALDPPALRAPLLPGAAADTVPEPGEGRVREADRLGIAAEVEMLVSILMASDTPLPLAVGLFGDWGSGKSFFMALMQERIEELARLSAQGSPEAAPFCSEVRQVRFNAWHYVDTNLWASLAATLFDELARPGTRDETQAKLTELDAARKKAAAATQRRQELEHEVTDLVTEADRPAAAAKSAVAVAIRAVRGEKVRENLVTASGGGPVDASTTLLLTTLGEIDSAAARARTVGRLFQEEVLYRRRWLTLVCLLVLLGLGAFAAVAASWPAGIKVLTFAGAVVAGLSPALAGALQVVYLARDAREALALPLATKRDELELARTTERGAAQQVALREQELAQLRDKGLRLQEFVRERAASSDYRGRLGVISQVRRDFEHLVALVPGQRPPAGAQQVAAVAEAVAERVPEVQRIVLYVDDLDRCPSEKVVEVLQAVHLLLAFKLFVVVVGVDSRWLERSLEAHYEALLEEPGNYLEKIFQIPFILQRMTPSRYQDLIEGLTALVGQPSGPAEARPAGTTASPAPEVPEASAGPATPTIPAETESPRVVATPEPAPPVLTPVSVPAAPVLPPPPALPRPEALVISAAERALLGHLGGIVPTPRAAKRLVNIYRMLRVSVPEDELGAFGPDSDGGGEYQAVILLLAILVGRPVEAAGVFGALRAASGEDDLWQVLDSYAAARRKMPGNSEHTAGLAGGADITAALGKLREHVTVSSAGPYRRWAPRVARFSFRLGTVPPGDEW